jgi:hypothetical protein
MAGRAPGPNTDDRTLIEFGFARSLGQTGLQNFGPIGEIAGELHTDRPDVVGTIDWERFAELRALADAIDHNRPAVRRATLPADARARADARLAYTSGNPPGALAAWKRQSAPPTSHFDLLLVAEGLAGGGDDAALPYIEALRTGHPVEADLLTARLRASQRRYDEASAALAVGLEGLRAEPLADRALVKRMLPATLEIAQSSKPHARRMFDALARPFALYLGEEIRIGLQLMVAGEIDDRAVAAALAPLEPDVPWGFDELARRAAAYRALNHPLADRARADLEAYVEGQPQAVLPAALGDAAEPDKPSPGPASRGD